MLFQNVIRHTIYLLAEAEREAALQQRLRGTAIRSTTASEISAPHRFSDRDARIVTISHSGAGATRRDQHSPK